MNRPLYGLNKIFVEQTYQSYLNIPRIIKPKVVLKAWKEYLRSIISKINRLDSTLENQRLLQ